MQKLIESAVAIFRAYPDASEEEILTRLIASGIERPAAMQLVALLPLAYGRVTLSDIIFPDIYYCHDAEGKPAHRGSLSDLPLWREVLDFATRDKAPGFPIASRSAEVRAANAALLDGKKPAQLVWSPAIFLWPLDSYAVPGQARRKPRWWRQIWDSPAEHSVTKGERTVTRVAMILALLVGSIAVTVVAYYAISVLREVHSPR